MEQKKIRIQSVFAVVVSASLGLYAEMMMVRLHASYFQIFAYFKNISLLSCFLGLGIGYATPQRSVSILRLGGLFLAQIAILAFLSTVSPARLLQNPVPELFSFGLHMDGHTGALVWPIVFLSSMFYLNAVCFILPGRLAARALEALPSLEGYGWNLVGSLLGIGFFTMLSALCFSPVTWVIVFCGMVGCLMRPLLWRSCLGLVLVCAAMVSVLSMPVGVRGTIIYSPYQYLVLFQDSGYKTLETNHVYYQRLLDLSDVFIRRQPSWRTWRDYYAFPYATLLHPARALIVGSGTGNDVAAALRMHVDAIDAVEIDPVIADMGRREHPEHPYQNARVHLTIGDARAYFLHTRQRYDTVVYGLLDAHTLLAPGSSGVRLDSFVYTREGVCAARRLLKPQGSLYMSFCVVKPELGRKLYTLLRDAFDGVSPAVYKNGYDDSLTFVAGKKPLRVPSDMQDVTALYSAGVIANQVPSDDWPFLYMEKRRYPVSYLFVICILAGLSWYMVSRHIPAGFRAFSPAAFFLGAGFMLMETKVITEWVLFFGSTWQVVAVAVAVVIIVSFLATRVVMFWREKRLEKIAYGGIFIALISGWLFSAVSGSAFFVLLGAGATIAVLFFSSIVFSCVVRRIGSRNALAANIAGAMLGGFLEYNVMFCGFRALYLIALGIYAIACIKTLSRELR